jgi:diguanylate cyclase (GGDEF)-like protein
VGALGVSLIIRFVLAHPTGSHAAVTTNVAYPLGDVLLIAQLVAAMAFTRWRPGRSWTFIGAGLVLFAVADVAYAYSTAVGHTYVLAIGPLWIIAFVLIAIGAWRADGPAVREVRMEGLAMLITPLVFALLATGLLAYGQAHPLGAVGTALAVTTLVLVMLRTALTFRETLSLLDSRRAALTDELTGLPNRRALNQRLRALMGDDADSGLSGLLLVDLDGFKELNDTLGHHAGDLLLTTIGDRFRDIEILRQAARLGGDEFAIPVINDAGPDALRAAADRLHEALEQPFEFDDLSVHIQASVGGALYPQHGEDPTELLRHADVAMYNAKETRSGYELYRLDRDLNSRDRLRLVGQLQRALDEHELVVYYQPKANPQTARVTGVEALIRWQHPTEGLLTPDRFLPLAETAGLMRQVTSYVLERALAQLAQWREGDLDLTMAVNLAMPNLLDQRLPDEVAQRLAQFDVPPSRLVLEITENIVMADPPRILDVVHRLADLGVGLSLDDFGAGASSLGYLKRLAIDELKIDRSFVMAMDHDEDSATIVHATIELAHNLGLRIVAEGVETKASWSRLTSVGCDEIQGFLLGRPVPADELTSLLDPTGATLAQPTPVPRAAEIAAAA